MSIFFGNDLSRHVNNTSPSSYNADFYLNFSLKCLDDIRNGSMTVRRGKISSFDFSPPVPTPPTQLGVPGVYLGFRHLKPKPHDPSLSLWKRFVEGLGWFDSRKLSAPFEHISFQCGWLGHNLEV